MLYEALLDLRLDIAIIRAPLASPPDALVVRPFVREKLCLALYQQHPLAGVGALNLASLRTDNWISLDDPQGTGLEQVFMDACRVAGFTPQVAQRINDVTSMISLVSAGVEWRWFRSRRGPYALITWCISISRIGWRRVS